MPRFHNILLFLPFYSSANPDVLTFETHTKSDYILRDPLSS